MIEKYKSFVLDCDGVILDSNRIKTEAFRKALADEPVELVEEFIQYHKDNGGVSRYIKLQYYFQEIKKKKEYSQILNETLVRFAEIVRSELVKASMVPGVEAFLMLCQEKGIPCFVNSGGDQDELREVFVERGIGSLFELILGSPTSKKDNLAKLLVENRLQQPVLFFGDAYSDYIAAEAYEIDFVYVSNVSEWGEGKSFCLNKNIPVIESFKEVIKNDIVKVNKKG